MAPHRCRQSQIGMRPAESQLHDDPARGQSTRGVIAASSQRAAGVQGLRNLKRRRQHFPHVWCGTTGSACQCRASRASRGRTCQGCRHGSGTGSSTFAAACRSSEPWRLAGAVPESVSLASRYLWCPRPPRAVVASSSNLKPPLSSLQVVVRAGLHSTFLFVQPTPHQTGPQQASPSPSLRREREVPQRGCTSHSQSMVVIPALSCRLSPRSQIESMQLKPPVSAS
jgi:hypothetical protein